MKKVYQSVVEWSEEDGGKALVADVFDLLPLNPTNTISVRLHSWDDAADISEGHTEARTLQGRIVRVTIEELAAPSVVINGTPLTQGQQMALLWAVSSTLSASRPCPPINAAKLAEIRALLRGEPHGE